MRMSLARAALVAALFTAPACMHPAAPAAPKVAADVKGMTKDQKIRKLLQLTGAEDLGKQTMDQMMLQFETMPGLPPGFARKFRELAMQQDLVSMLIPVYAKNLEEKDIDGAIVFYESDEGRAVSRAQPIIVRESMQIGQQWGQDLAMKTMKALHDEDQRQKETQ